MRESALELARKLRRIQLSRTQLKWLLVALMVLLFVASGIWALYWAIGPDSVNARNEFARTVVQILGGGALLTSLYFSYRTLQLNFRSQEENQQANRDRDVTARFTSAVEQLGNEKLEVRLGAIYALERLSKDSDTDYSTIMELLTAYVRERSSRKKSNESEVEHQVRLNSPIGIDIQAVLTVIQRRGKSFGDGESVGLDLRGTHLRGADLGKARLERAEFERADLEGASFFGAQLQRANLQRANLQRAHFHGANLEMTNFLAAQLQGALFHGAKNLKEAYFQKSQLLEGGFDQADLSRLKSS